MVKNQNIVKPLKANRDQNNSSFQCRHCQNCRLKSTGKAPTKHTIMPELMNIKTGSYVRRGTIAETGRWK